MLQRVCNILSRRDQVGASAVEYGLLLAGVTALVIGIVFVFGGVVKSTYQGTCNRLKQGSSSTAATC